MIIRHGDIYYGSAFLNNGLYILDLNCREPIYNVNTKRVKLNELNPSYIWHCRLGHVRKKCINRVKSNKLNPSYSCIVV